MKRKSRGKLENGQEATYAVKFSLSFLDDDPSEISDMPSYEYELLTAQEKADYFAHLNENGGKENVFKIAKECKNRAAALRLKASHLDKDSARPLIEHANRLESHARSITDIVPDDVLASQLPMEVHAISGTKRPAKEFDPMAWLSEFLPQTNEEKAEFWRNIHNWTPKEQLLYYFSKPETVMRSEVLFVRAQKDPNALIWLKSGAQLAVERLLDLASLGNTKAAEEAVKIIEGMVRRLTLYAKAYPETFIPVARALIEWPVIYSTLPKLQEKPEDIADSIQLDKDYPFEIHSQAKWDPREPGCKIVLELFRHINSVRTTPDEFKHFPYCQRAQELPSIKADNACEKWWEVAVETLKYGRDSLADEPHLSVLAKGAATRKHKSRIEQRILERLKSRFRKLFPKDRR